MKSSTTKYSNKMTSINTSMGNISIDNEAIAQYAGSVAMECFGVVELLKLDSMTRGINVMVRNNKLVINFHIIVAYGVSILAVSNNLISNVKYKVEEFTGIEIEKINIFVEGVKVID